ncbi:MAG: hypothetical protein ABI123_09105 [Ginsengibacter sp.]
MIGLSANNGLTEGIGKGNRLASLDFYRGLVMVLLMIEASGLYDHIQNMTTPGSVIHSIANQFSHYPWHGLHLRDFIQPAFMFIAGTAMVISDQTKDARLFMETTSFSVLLVFLAL